MLFLNLAKKLQLPYIKNFKILLPSPLGVDVRLPRAYQELSKGFPHPVEASNLLPIHFHSLHLPSPSILHSAETHRESISLLFFLFLMKLTFGYS